jgi:hypothetical protein
VYFKSLKSNFRFRFPEIDLFKLQVLVFPLKAGGSGLGNEPNLASPVLDFPMLSAVVEFDVAGPGDFELPKFMQR